MARSFIKKCSHCGKDILVSLNRCPECGFVFANVALFSKYISLAEKALKQGKLNEAREQLIRAKIAEPNEQSQTVSLEKSWNLRRPKLRSQLRNFVF